MYRQLRERAARQQRQRQQKIERLYVPVKRKKTEMITGSPGDIAKKIVEHLRDHARVI